MSAINHKRCLFLFSVFLVGCTASQLKRNEISNAESQSIIPYYPLDSVSDLDVLLRNIGDAKIVLLGESTHGTSEYYQWRAAITKKLIQEKGFNIIGVEGDWVDSYRVNQFIKGPSADSNSSVDVLRQYDRWPQYMWGNYEMASLVQWLNGYNQDREPESKVGFYGLDLYSFWEWTEQKLMIGDSTIQNLADLLRQRFSSFNNDALRYADSIRKSKQDCHVATEQLWKAVKNF